MYRGACSWFRDYLSTDPAYPSHRFREVFRIPIPLYWLLHDELVDGERILEQKTDAYGIQGHTSRQKIPMTLRRLATSLCYRQMDDMARISVESQHQVFILTPRVIFRRFGPVYLNRKPTESELRTIVRQ